MFKKSIPQKTHFILAALFALCSLSSIALATEPPDAAGIKFKWLKDRLKALPGISNIVVLGPSSHGKSTLINLLIHTSEYATRAKEGDVFLDSDEQMEAIYHKDIFRFDVNTPVNPKNFDDATLPEDCKEIPGIEAFMPVLGPISVNDFLHQRSASSFDREQEYSAEKVCGGTAHPHVYSSHKKVSSPVFQTTIIDAPGIGKSERLAFFKTVVEKAPSDAIHAFLLVVSAEELAKDTFGPKTFEYFKEIADILKQFDPTYTRVVLAVTHASNENFRYKIPTGDDAHRVAAEKFEKATSIVVAASNIFFFENKYNCLSENAIDSLYACHTGGNVYPDVEEAHLHRQKNYQLNVLESFNLLKAVAKTKPALSRHEILEQISTTLGSRMPMKTYAVGSKYSNGTPVMTSSSPGFLVWRAVLIPYQTTDGAWWLKGHAYFTVNNLGRGPASMKVNLSGVTFKNSVRYYQNVNALSTCGSSLPGNSYVKPDTGDVIIAWQASQTSFNDSNFSFDVELDAKPTWAD